jgi:hypothetical protein
LWIYRIGWPFETILVGAFAVSSHRWFFLVFLVPVVVSYAQLSPAKRRQVFRRGVKSGN